MLVMLAVVDLTLHYIQHIFNKGKKFKLWSPKKIKESYILIKLLKKYYLPHGCTASL